MSYTDDPTRMRYTQISTGTSMYTTAIWTTALVPGGSYYPAPFNESVPPQPEKPKILKPRMKLVPDDPSAKKQRKFNFEE